MNEQPSPHTEVIISEAERLVPPDFVIQETEDQVKRLVENGYPNYPSTEKRLVMTDTEIDEWIKQGKPTNILDWLRQRRTVAVGNEFQVYHHPNRNLGIKLGIADIDDGSKDLMQVVYESADYEGVGRDSRGRPLLPERILRWFLKHGAIDGPGWYWKYGPNKAADPIVFQEVMNEEGMMELKLLVLERTDLSSTSLPGGMVDKGEQSISAALRELFEEALGGTMTKFKAYFESLLKTLIHRGVVMDERMTMQAWPETSVWMMLVDSDVAKVMRFKESKESVNIRWETVNRGLLEKLFASHGDFVRAAVLAYEENSGKVVRNDGIVGKKGM